MCSMPVPSIPGEDRETWRSCQYRVWSRDHEDVLGFLGEGVRRKIFEYAEPLLPSVSNSYSSSGNRAVPTPRGRKHPDGRRARTIDEYCSNAKRAEARCRQICNEAEKACQKIRQGTLPSYETVPLNAYYRRLLHEIAAKHGLVHESFKWSDAENSSGSFRFCADFMFGSTPQSQSFDKQVATSRPRPAFWGTSPEARNSHRLKPIECMSTCPGRWCLECSEPREFKVVVIRA